MPNTLAIRTGIFSPSNSRMVARPEIRPSFPGVRTEPHTSSTGWRKPARQECRGRRGNGFLR